MALDREIEQLRSDASQWRALARRLPDLGREVLTDWELDFLEEIPARTWLDNLSYRQAEILLQIRDSVETVSSYRGFSVKWLCSSCYENRLDLDDEDQEWVIQIYQRDRTSVRKGEARRLFGFARRLGLIEDH